MDPLTIVTDIAVVTCWLCASENVAVQFPAATPVTLNASAGPVPLLGSTVAIPLQVSLSRNVPL